MRRFEVGELGREMEVVEIGVGFGVYVEIVNGIGVVNWVEVGVEVGVGVGVGALLGWWFQAVGGGGIAKKKRSTVVMIHYH